MKQKNALIIGGDGFIGWHLTNRLINDGYKCTIIDNHMTSNPSKRDDCIVIDEDWMNLEIFDYINDFDDIYFLASLPSPKSYKKYPLMTLDLGLSVEKLFEFAMDSRTSHVFLASSSEVYGNTTEPMIEGVNYGHVNSYGPRACYDESKRVMETLAYIYQPRMKDTKIHIGRIFNTYGTHMANDGRVFTSFVNSCIKGERLQIYRDPSVTRSPCYVTDLVDQIIILMNSDYTEPINLGNDKEYSLRWLAQNTIAAYNRVTNNNKSLADFVVLNTGETDKDDPLVRKPNIEKIKNLGYLGPKIEFINGIELLIKEKLGIK